jgi:hypothetical protein
MIGPLHRGACDPLSRSELWYQRMMQRFVHFDALRERMSDVYVLVPNLLTMLPCNSNLVAISN